MMTHACHSTIKTRWLILSLSIAILLSGCASLTKGVTQAFIEKAESVDTRLCQVAGIPFIGVEPLLIRKQGKMKVLMVHGVGDHIPGYSSQFLEKFAKELNLNNRSRNYKEIQLTTPLFPGTSLGNLRITHLSNEDNGAELLFYELTWSEISREEKSVLAFDNSGEYDYRRAVINGIMKKFNNDVTPDPIIYLGKSREPILASFAQSFCWMAARDWKDLPESGKHTCEGLNDTAAPGIINDDYAFISHSLGSRVVIDGMQRIAAVLANPGIIIRRIEEAQPANQDQRPILSTKAIAALQNKRVPIFMLSNQLPMLQLGRELPEVAGQRANYCEPEGPDYRRRMVKETAIIAFSDPNDILSYAIPVGFTDKYLDSRLCSNVTNININVAKVVEALETGTVANPLEAHVGYMSDDRVIALIAKGIDNPNTAPLVIKRCGFTKIGQ